MYVSKWGREAGGRRGFEGRNNTATFIYETFDYSPMICTRMYIMVYDKVKVNVYR